MLKEWQTNILRPEAAELLTLDNSRRIREDPELRKRVVPTRWVLVEKDQGPGEETTAKARLVVQGFRDPDLGDLEVASPTLSKDSLLLILQMLASFQWRLCIADIKGAFMSSRPLCREGGELYASLPQLWMHPQEADRAQLLKIKVAWYGLNDGPREFYETLDQELRALGCDRSPLDPCVYLWKNQGAPAGVLGITVDDICGGGSDKFVQQVLEPLQQRFSFGKICHGEGQFTGRYLKQLDDYSVTIDQIEYAQNLMPIDIPRHRRMDKEALLSDQERSELRAKAGELNWLQSISRPDLSGAVSLLQTSFAEPRIKHMFEVNRLIREAKAHQVKLQMKHIPPQHMTFVCSADSAWANCVDFSNHMGYIVLAAHDDISRGKRVPVSIVGWKAHKQRRRTASTLAAETLATSSGMGALDWIRTCWAWMTNCQFRLQN